MSRKAKPRPPELCPPILKPRRRLPTIVDVASSFQLSAHSTHLKEYEQRIRTPRRARLPNVTGIRKIGSSWSYLDGIGSPMQFQTVH